MVKKQKTISDVLVVGCGSIGRRHISNLLNRDSIRKIYTVTKRNHFPDEFAKNDRIVFSESVLGIHADMAVIANETEKHMSSAIQLASAGMDLFIEKPLSHTIDGFEELETLVKKKRLKAFVAYNLRFLKAFLFIKKIIADKTIGELHFARIEVGQYLPSWRPNRDYRTTYSAKQSQGGGVALDLSHEIDYMRYLFGDPVVWKVLKARISNLEIETEDIFEGMYCFPGNFVCTIHLDYLQKKAVRSMQIVGSAGTLVCDFLNRRIVVTVDSFVDTITDPDLFDINKTYPDEMEHFIRAIETDTEPLITLDDGMKICSLIEDCNVAKT